MLRSHRAQNLYKCVVVAASDTRLVRAGGGTGDGARLRFAAPADSAHHMDAVGIWRGHVCFAHLRKMLTQVEYMPG